MRSLSNVELLLAGISVAFFLTISIVLQVNAGQHVLLALTCTAAVAIAIAFVGSRIERNLPSDSKWRRAVSEATGSAIFDGALSVFLVLVGVLFVAMLFIGFDISAITGGVGVFLLLAGFGCGWLLQRRTFSNSKLPYVVCLTLALLLEVFLLQSLNAFRPDHSPMIGLEMILPGASAAS